MSKPPVLLPLFLFQLFSAVSFAADSNCFRDATSVWHFRDERDSRGRIQLVNHGVKLEAAPEGNESKSSGSACGDGHYALLSGTEWFSFEEREPAFNASDGTLLVRFYPQKSGGIITTSRLSVVIHESGLLIVVVSVRDARGTLFREIPFALVEMNAWHNLTVRYHGGFVSVEMDGIQQGKVALGGELASIPIGQAFIGKWKLEQMPVPGFPNHVVDMLFQKIFTGRIDHVAIWNRPLSDAEVAVLSNARRLTRAPDHTYDECIRAYRDFYAASRKMDVKETERLGLVMRKFMARDKRHPVYHLTGPTDAILDPAGATFYNGQYHVYSYRNMVSLLAATPLAHFVSDDLIHWKDYPIGAWADSPFDVFGIWLANIFKGDDQKPNMLYTGLGTTGKYGILARSEDNLLSIEGKTAVLTDMVHHDGHTWKDGDEWYTITTKQYWGTRPGDLGDAIVLYSSPDLIHWKEQGEIFSVRKSAKPADESQQQGFTEYPYLLPFGDKHVLMAGTRPSMYWTGTFDKRIPAFIPDHPEGMLIDHLNTFHCFNPMTVDDKGPGASPRRIVEAMHLYASGNADGIPWYGVHTLPRVLTRVGDRLHQAPVPEAEQLRKSHQQKRAVHIGPGTTMDAICTGNELELIAEFEPGTARKFGLVIGADKDGRNGVRLYYDVADRTFNVDGNIKRPANYPELGKATVVPADTGSIKVHVFIDHNFFEVFADGETFTGVFNGDPDQQDIFLFSEEGDVTLANMDIWTLEPAWGIR